MSDYDQEWYVKQRIEFRKRVKRAKRAYRQGGIPKGDRRLLMTLAFIASYKSFPRRMLFAR